MSGIVVGVDGSPESLQALRFAAGEAALREADLLAVYVLERPALPWPELDGLVGTALERANRVFHEAIEETFTGRPPIAVTREVVEAAPAAALIDASAGADLLVVGSRGRGGFASLLLGSVSHQCAVHAPCPVAVVRGEARLPHESGGVIVVGVDGSEASMEALRWADREARARSALLRVVHAWHARIYAGPGLMPIPPVDVGPAAQRLVRDVVRDVLGSDRLAEVETLAVEGLTAESLLEAARAADLLVVGARGLGGFAGLLLGSISHQCAAHANCPVVVVRAPA